MVRPATRSQSCDAHSRFPLRCEGVLVPDGDTVAPIFESAFREYGIPNAIRSDNGPPFASTGAGGLTPLSAWWIKLGIVPERIEPGKPQQNGRHERMHRTLKQETASPPEDNIRAQQRLFDRFRAIYNQERPHEALGQKPPASVYVESTRRYPARQPQLNNRYDCEHLAVERDGHVRWGRRRVLISASLAHELVDLVPAGPSQWEVRFGPIALGILDAQRKHKGLIRPTSPKPNSEFIAWAPF